MRIHDRSSARRGPATRRQPRPGGRGPAHGVRGGPRPRDAGARVPHRQRPAVRRRARPRLRRRLRRVRGHGPLLAAVEGPRRALVLRGRPRRPRLAARRARRALQHGRARLDGHAPDRADRDVRLHAAHGGALRHARPHRGDPREHVRARQEWDGDRCRLWAQGTVRQEIAYGEHLVLERRYETEIGARSFTITDRVTNEGWFDTAHQLLYHFNLGFPLLGDRAGSWPRPDPRRPLVLHRLRERARARRWRT